MENKTLENMTEQEFLEFLVRAKLDSFLRMDTEEIREIAQRWRPIAEKWAVEDGAKRESPATMLYVGFCVGLELGFNICDSLQQKEERELKTLSFVKDGNLKPILKLENTFKEGEEWLYEFKIIYGNNKQFGAGQFVTVRMQDGYTPGDYVVHEVANDLYEMDQVADGGIFNSDCFSGKVIRRLAML